MELSVWPFRKKRQSAPENPFSAMVLALECVKDAIKAKSSEEAMASLTAFLVPFALEFGDTDIFDRTFPVLERAKKQLASGDFDNAMTIVLVLLDQFRKASVKVEKLRAAGSEALSREKEEAARHSVRASLIAMEEARQRHESKPGREDELEVKNAKARKHENQLLAALNSPEAKRLIAEMKEMQDKKAQEAQRREDEAPNHNRDKAPGTHR
jgi:hypothetical protein